MTSSLYGHTETYRGCYGQTITIERSNTSLDGYVPILRELQGAIFLSQGAYKVAFGLAALGTNEGLKLRGIAQIKDGLINLSVSPITGFALGLFACQYTSC